MVKAIRCRFALAAALWLGAAGFCVVGVQAAGAPAEVVQALGLTAGLAVCVGGDGQAGPAMAVGNDLCVQVMALDAEGVTAVRLAAAAAGLGGRVTAERLDGGRLPLVDNLANLAIVAGTSAVPAAEVARVLAPRGIAAFPAGQALPPTPPDRKSGV